MKKRFLQLKNVVRAVMIALLLGVVGKMYSYDFSAICETGQTLYYNIIDAENHWVELTCPTTPNLYGWSGFTQPTGALIIPENIQYDGTTYIVTSIGNYAFSNCGNLTSINLPIFVTSIGYGAFYGCSGLTGCITIPNSVIVIDSFAFYNCIGFTGSLTIPDSVTTIGSCAFSGCTGFVGFLTIGNSVTSIGSDAFYNCSGFIGNLTIGNSVTTIGQRAFGNCSGFTGDLIIGNSVTSIEYRAFYGCSGFMGNLTIGNSVTTIGYGAFSDCSGFTGNLVIPNSVTTIGYEAFSNCSGFTGTLTIPNSLATISEHAFYNCTGFTEVRYNATNCANAYSNTQPFLGCNGTLVIGDNVERIPDYMFNSASFTGSLIIGNSVTTIGQYAFYGCSGFTGSLTIPNSVTTIGNFAFSNCSGFTGSLNISNSLTSIGQGTFKNCSGFTDNLTIPNSLTTIGHNVFNGCCGLTALIIPNSVTEIGNYTFSGCSGITEIYSKNVTPPSLGRNAFQDVNHSIPVYVPCGRQPYYRRATGWSDFNNYQGRPSDIIVDVNSNMLGEASLVQYGNCDEPQTSVQAIPRPGCVFTNWTVNGEIVSNEAYYTFNLTEDIILVANFEVGSNHHLFVGTNSNLWSDVGNWIPNEMPTETCIVSFWADVEVDIETTIMDAYLYGNRVITIKPQSKLAISGTIIPSDNYSLTIENEGQFVHAVDGINATVQKTVTPYTFGTKDGWHLISHPMVGNLDIATVENLTSNEFDLYYYDEPTHYWMNQELSENNFTQMEVGKGYLYANNCGSMVSYEFNFNDGTMQGWTSIDADGDGYEWFLAFDVSSAHSGVGYIGSESWKDPGPGMLFPDNLVVSPQIQFSIVSSISFWTCAADVSFPAEHFGVAVSTTGNTDVADFITIQEWDLSAKMGRNIGTWYEYTVDLSQYAGQTGYVAIRHFNCSEQGALLIDDIMLSSMMEIEESIPLSFYGELQNGSAIVNVPLSYTPNISLSGFNLVGNPYAHNITLYDSENVANGCYMMNETKDNLVVSEISETNPLKPTEGFFVKALAEGAYITFNAPSRDKTIREGFINMELLENGKLIDRLIVKREGESLEKLMLKENSTKIFATQNHQEIAIVPCRSNEQAVNFKAAKNGNYTLVVNIEGLEMDYLHLIDNLTGNDIDLLVTPNYTFEAKTSDYASRFRLMFSVCGDADGANGKPFAFISNGDIVISGAEANATLQIVDMLGHVIVGTDVVRNIATNGMASGVYVLRLINGNDVKMQKIVIH